MPWSKVDGSEVEACSADQVAVVKDADGEVEGCHDTEDEANDQIAALEASEDDRAPEDVDLSPPDAMQTAAQMGLDKKGELGLRDCGTGVGEKSAEQITAGDIQPGRMRDIAAYLVSHAEDWPDGETPSSISDEQLQDGCGPIQYLLWGGGTDTAYNWALRKANEIAEEEGDTPPYDESDMRSMTRASVEDLSEGDLVAWDASGGTAYGQIDTIAMGETVSGSLEPDDTEHETSEDDPGLIIELVEKEDGDVMGTGDTVFHRPGTVSKVTEGDVPERGTDEHARRTGSYRAVLPDANIRQTADDDTVTVQFMTEQVARDGMVLDADGIDTDAFEKNPVVLWSHGTDPRRGDEPIGKASNVRRNGDGMLADVTFAGDEFAQRIQQKVQDGFVNAVSIGWRTEEMDTDGDAPTVTRSDMTEFSFVAVPADTDALVQERTAGSNVRQQIAQLEEEIKELKEQRAEATATSPPETVDSEGTPDESAEQGRAEEPRTSPRMATRQDYKRLAGELMPLVRTELRKQLGKQ